MSNADPINPAPEGVPAPGQQLRLARESRGESRAEVAQSLKLSLRQVEALEQGDYTALPGPAFVRGFMRNYARHLGLDPAPLLATLDGAEAGAPVELALVSNAAGEMPQGGAERRASRLGATLAVILLFAVLAGWYFDWFRTDPPPGLNSDVGETVLPPAGDVAVEPVPTEPAPVQAGGAPAPVEQQPGTGSVPAPVPVPPAPAPASAAPASAPLSAADGGAQPATPQLLFRFGGESWVEVRDGSGAVIYSGLGSTGSTRSVQGRPPFALVVGNAKDVRLEFNGREIDLQPHTRVAVARLTVQ